MASSITKSGVASLTALLAVAAFVVLSPKNDSSEHNASTPPEPTGKTQPTEVEVPVNFTLPLYTGPSTLVCPLAIAFDPREGYGLKGAVDAHLSIFGHDDAIQKSGCEEWREDLPVSLTDEGQHRAIEFQSEKLCSMVTFTDGYVFSCDLRNSSGADSNNEVLNHAKQEVANAMQDPSKVRLMECIGVNPWEVKPAGWTPPTKEECTALEQKLGVAADGRTATAPPATPSEEDNSVQQANLGFQTYTNTRYGFRVDYPESFRPEQPPENGDGVTLKSEDGKATLVFSGRNNAGFTLRDEFDIAIKNVQGQLGYNKTGGSWFVVTWTDGDNIGYTKEFVGPGSQNLFTITFPVEQKPQYDSAVTKIEKSFQPGDLDNSH
jgi:hypothetical protein